MALSSFVVRPPTFTAGASGITSDAALGRARRGDATLVYDGRVDRLAAGEAHVHADPGITPHVVASRLLERVLTRGVDALAAVQGDFTACLCSEGELTAFRSFTAPAQVYWSDDLISNRLLEHARDRAPEPDPAFRLRFVLGVATLQHGFETTPLAGVRRLLPGHTVTSLPGRAARVRQLVRRAYRYVLEPLQRREDVAPRLRHLLTECVEDRIRDASRPVWCELSGGLDSSFVACLAARARESVCAYMFSRPDRPSHRSSEEYAREVADRYGIALTVLAPSDLPRVDLREPVYADEPTDFFWYGRLFGGAAARVVPEGATVLTGFGADQLFLRSPRILPYLLRRGQLRRFGDGLASVGKLLSRSRASLAWQSALSALPRRLHLGAAAPFSRLAVNPFAADDVSMDRALTGGVAWLRAPDGQGALALRERLEDEHAAADARLIGDGIVCDDLGYLSATRFVDGPFTDPRAVTVESPFCDLRLLDFVYDEVSLHLVHDFDARYKELLRAAQEGIVPDGLRARQSDTFSFDASRDRLLADNKDAVRELFASPDLDAWLDRAGAARALAELEFGVQSSSTRALLAAAGYLVWWRDFKEAARALT
jgi:asparagine synthase (glutamine-hydrolysing)